jgi:hypothetical protein
MVFTLPLVGQTTWGGLRFGMTEMEVRAAMGDRLETIVDPPGPESYIPFHVKSVVIGRASGVANLAFDIQKKTLRAVGLDLSRTEKFTGDAPEMGPRAAGYDDVSKSLLQKYGKPVDEVGRCPTMEEVLDYFIRDHFNRGPLGTIKCSRLWREPQQTIEMKVDVIGSALFLTVSYKPLPSEL